VVSEGHYLEQERPLVEFSEPEDRHQFFVLEACREQPVWLEVGREKVEPRCVVVVDRRERRVLPVDFVQPAGRKHQQLVLQVVPVAQKVRPASSAWRQSAVIQALLEEQEPVRVASVLQRVD
jgi:hypothetical protein